MLNMDATAALTEADVERLFGIVRLLRERGVGIVYIGHRLEEVFVLADRPRSCATASTSRPRPSVIPTRSVFRRTTAPKTLLPARTPGGVSVADHFQEPRRKYTVA